jgi:predicted alpha/beta superfamily hydrolase
MVVSPLRRGFLLWGLVMILGTSGGASNAPSPERHPGAHFTITFRVTVPDSTPAGAAIWISGNRALLGNWSGAGLAARRVGDRLYEASAAFPESTALEFKITRGGWDTVEKGPHGEELANRRHLVTADDTLRVEVAAWRDQTETPPPRTVTGDVRYLRNVTSRYLPRSRDVAVYLPPGYDDHPERRYPVLYMQDGQNLFDRATGFMAREWNVDETAERLIGEGRVAPLIVVGVYNTPDRIGEYTPAPDARGRGGDAEDYGRFLVEELKPRIDGLYRTLPDREHTGIAGSSLGGLVSMFLALRYPETFSRIGVVSPSVWWADEDILGRVRDAPKTGARIWLDVGTAEGSGPAEAARIVAGARRLRDALMARGWTLGKDLIYAEYPGARHNEAAWSARMGSILEYLFPPEPGGGR